MKTPERGGNFRWKLGFTHIEDPREDCSRKRYQYRESHEQEFRAVTGRFGHSLGCCSEDWHQEVFKAAPDRDESADDRKKGEDHQRHEHDCRALMRLAV